MARGGSNRHDESVTMPGPMIMGLTNRRLQIFFFSFSFFLGSRPRSSQVEPAISIQDRSLGRNRVAKGQEAFYVQQSSMHTKSLCSTESR